MTLRDPQHLATLALVERLQAELARLRAEVAVLRRGRGPAGAARCWHVTDEGRRVLAGEHDVVVHFNGPDGPRYVIGSGVVLDEGEIDLLHEDP